jgi:hypothetical protein
MNGKPSDVMTFGEVIVYLRIPNLRSTSLPSRARSRRKKSDGIGVSVAKPLSAGWKVYLSSN